MAIPQTSLPLFPLNLVLFPGMFQALHIFEPRYQAMIKHCMAEQSPFGIVLIASGTAEGDEAAEPYAIGTIAKIVQVQHQGQGRMNLWVVGQERFKVARFGLAVDEYLVAHVDPLPDEQADPVLLAGEMNTLRGYFKTYVDLILALSQEDKGEINYNLAEEPSLFSFQIASILDVASAEKQNLLEMVNVSQRLVKEVQIMEREIAWLEQLLKSQSISKTQELPWGGEIFLN